MCTDALDLDILTGLADRRIDTPDLTPREIRLIPLTVIDPPQVGECKQCTDCKKEG